MKSIEILSIPVYLCNEAEFDVKYKERFIEPHLSEYAPVDLEARLYHLHYPKNVWRFNQIIGYIVITFDKFSNDHYDINIEKWLSRTKRNSIVSRKDNIAPTSNTGDHFHVTSWDGEFLTNEIMKYIENDDTYMNRFIDYSVLERFMRTVDFNKLKREVSEK